MLRNLHLGCWVGLPSRRGSWIWVSEVHDWCFGHPDLQCPVTSSCSSQSYRAVASQRNFIVPSCVKQITMLKGMVALTMLFWQILITGDKLAFQVCVVLPMSLSALDWRQGRGRLKGKKGAQRGDVDLQIAEVVSPSSGGFKKKQSNPITICWQIIYLTFSFKQVAILRRM